MKVGTVYEVATPGDSRHQYSTSWRHEAAKAVKDYNDISHRILSDDYVYIQNRYLHYTEHSDMLEAFEDLALDQSDNSLLMTVHNANALRSSGIASTTAARIDAMLLCPDLTYSDIARAYNQDTEVIRVYEKIFFNVRDADGRILPSKGLVEYFATQGLPRLHDANDYAAHWRAVAFESGHSALLNIWAWPEGDIVPSFTDFESSKHLLRQTFRYADTALRTGRGLDSKAFSAIFENLHHRFGEYREKGMLSGTEAMSEEHIMLQILELMQPERMLQTAERKEESKRSLGDRLKALKTTAGTTEEATNLDFIESQLENK